MAEDDEDTSTLNQPLKKCACVVLRFDHSTERTRIRRQQRWRKQLQRNEWPFHPAQLCIIKGAASGAFGGYGAWVPAPVYSQNAALHHQLCGTGSQQDV